MACRFEYSSDSAAAKGNEFAVEALKQLLTIAGALLVLTITFIKDILGNHAVESRCFLLLPAGWLSLSLSLWWGWVAIADGARQLGRGEMRGYVFGCGMPRRLARLAQASLFAGIFCVGLFVVLNISHGSKGEETGRPGKPDRLPVTVPSSMK